MNIKTINYIKNNPNIYAYLRMNSHWYKYLNRDGFSIRSLEEEVKSYYKLTTGDRIEKIGNNINLVSSIMEIFK